MEQAAGADESNIVGGNSAKMSRRSLQTPSVRDDHHGPEYGSRSTPGAVDPSHRLSTPNPSPPPHTMDNLLIDKDNKITELSQELKTAYGKIEGYQTLVDVHRKKIKEYEICKNKLETAESIIEVKLKLIDELQSALKSANHKLRSWTNAGNQPNFGDGKSQENDNLKMSPIDDSDSFIADVRTESVQCSESDPRTSDKVYMVFGARTNIFSRDVISRLTASKATFDDSTLAETHGFEFIGRPSSKHSDHSSFEVLSEKSRSSSESEPTETTGPMTQGPQLIVPTVTVESTRGELTDSKKSPQLGDELEGIAQVVLALEEKEKLIVPLQEEAERLNRTVAELNDQRIQLEDDLAFLRTKLLRCETERDEWRRQVAEGPPRSRSSSSPRPPSAAARMKDEEFQKLNEKLSALENANKFLTERLKLVGKTKMADLKDERTPQVAFFQIPDQLLAELSEMRRRSRLAEDQTIQQARTIVDLENKLQDAERRLAQRSTQSPARTPDYNTETGHLKAQLEVYRTDFESEHQELQQLQVKYDRDIETLQTDVRLTRQLLRESEEEKRLLKQDNTAFKTRLRELTEQLNTQSLLVPVTTASQNKATRVGKIPASRSPSSRSANTSTLSSGISGVDRTVWSCRACTYNNPVERTYCEICGTAGNTTYREPVVYGTPLPTSASHHASVETTIFTRPANERISPPCLETD